MEGPVEALVAGSVLLAVGIVVAAGVGRRRSVAEAFWDWNPPAVLAFFALATGSLWIAVALFGMGAAVVVSAIEVAALLASNPRLRRTRKGSEDHQQPPDRQS